MSIWRRIHAWPLKGSTRNGKNSTKQVVRQTDEPKFISA
jgi:hypothetical protein